VGLARAGLRALLKFVAAGRNRVSSGPGTPTCGVDACPRDGTWKSLPQWWRGRRRGCAGGRSTSRRCAACAPCIAPAAGRPAGPDTPCCAPAPTAPPLRPRPSQRPARRTRRHPARAAPGRARRGAPTPLATLPASLAVPRALRQAARLMTPTTNLRSAPSGTTAHCETRRTGSTVAPRGASASCRYDPTRCAAALVDGPGSLVG
jgi:hypothetical protein